VKVGKTPVSEWKLKIVVLSLAIAMVLTAAIALLAFGVAHL